MLGYAQNSTSPVKSPLFQCQFSSEQSRKITTPNIPGFDFSHENAAAFSNDPNVNLTILSRGTTYIFTILPESAQRNCSGSVIAIQYCYEPRVLNASKRTFEFLSLIQDGQQFTVNRTFRINSTPTSLICTNSSTSEDIRETCCDTTTLEDTTPFQIPSSSYTFGITIRLHRLLGFTYSATEYVPEQFQTKLTEYPIPIGLNFTLNETDRLTDKPFPLLRFLIGIYKYCQEIPSVHAWLSLA